MNDSDSEDDRDYVPPVEDGEWSFGISVSGIDSHKDAHSFSDEDSESEEPAIHRNPPAAESEGRKAIGLISHMGTTSHPT